MAGSSWFAFLFGIIAAAVPRFNGDADAGGRHRIRILPGNAVGYEPKAFQCPLDRR
jgi:hypothetical protein